MFQVIGSDVEELDFEPLSWSFFVKKGNSILKIWQFHKFSDLFISQMKTKYLPSEPDLQNDLSSLDNIDLKSLNSYNSQK